VTNHTTERETIDDKLRGQQPGAVAVNSYLFVVLEGDRPLAGGARYSLKGVEEIIIARGSERGASVDVRDGLARLRLSLPSPLLSRLQTRLRREPAGWLMEDAGSRNGSYVNGRRVERARLDPDDVLEVGHGFIVIRAFPQRLDEPTTDLDSSAMDGEAPAFRTLVPTVAARLANLRRVAGSSIAILMCGETGTGKEVLARAVHELSARPGPFVAVNCATLTEGLAESQLFGHVKGAFSGAVGSAVGFVRAADGGTLLLDEVADLNNTAQAALLRVLQEHEVVPVGQARAQGVDVRFIATTPRPLDAAVGQELFRSDLFGRLSGFIHNMTPLRERREDVGLLAAALLHKAGAREGDGLRIAPESGLELVRHTWPLNVRELEQALVRSRLLSADGVMRVDLGAAPGARVASVPAPVLSAADRELHARVSEALATARGNVSEVARTLGKGRIAVHRLLRRLKIDPSRFRG